MKVCIGITTKNRCDVLPKAIQSALRQNYQNKEIVIFNDGSTDDTELVKAQFPGVRWMRSETSLGLLEARNQLMKSTDAELYITLDDDAWFLQDDEISIAVALMEMDPKLAVVAFDILQAGTRRFKPVPRTGPIPTNVFIGCGTMLRLKSVEEAGAFVSFPVRYGHEEKDLSIRMIDRGYRLLFVPGVHIWHDYSMVERNLYDQRKSLIINDLIYQYRRVPKLYLLPVLVNNICRKLRSKDDPRSLAKEGIIEFMKLIPTQKNLINRVGMDTYWRYRTLSKSFLAFLNQTDQKV